MDVCGAYAAEALDGWAKTRTRTTAERVVVVGESAAARVEGAKLQLPFESEGGADDDDDDDDDQVGAKFSERRTVRAGADGHPRPKRRRQEHASRHAFRPQANRPSRRRDLDHGRPEIGVR